MAIGLGEGWGGFRTGSLHSRRSSVLLMLMRALLLALMLASLPFPAFAQQQDAYEIDLSGIDVAMVLAGAEDVLLRASDRDVDGLYQAVLAASQSEEEAQVLCELFDPDADRSLGGLQRAANRLGPQSRARFADAVVAIAVGGMQNSLQAYDPAIDRKSVV